MPCWPRSFCPTASRWASGSPEWRWPSGSPCSPAPSRWDTSRAGTSTPRCRSGWPSPNRFPWREFLPYVVTQILAGTVAGAVLFVIANGTGNFSASASGFATNGYGDRSPGGYNLLSCFIIEVVLTAVFLYVILGSTDDRAPKGFAPIAIGLSLTLIHLVSIPVTNTSVNPARSLGVAWFVGCPST